MRQVRPVARDEIRPLVIDVALDLGRGRRGSPQEFFREDANDPSVTGDDMIGNVFVNSWTEAYSGKRPG